MSEFGDWRGRGLLFDRAAADYFDGRPGYPERVFELLAERCGLATGSRVLEVGAGSGTATLPLLQRGARVTAVEPGAALTKQLTTRTGGGVETVVARFEDAALPPEAFDLVVSATAFHWVDPTVGYAKAALVLRDGGWLAVWWTLWGDPNGRDPLHLALLPVLAVKAPQLIDEGGAPLAHALDRAARVAEFHRTGEFGAVSTERIEWSFDHDPASARRLFATFSPWLALQEQLRQELLDDVERLVRDELSGVARRRYLTVVYFAQRRTRLCLP